jgi:DNA (cytosine-5)-methyltransferase 1
MGFDLPGGTDFIMPVSDTQAYRQFGNAVVVPVVRAVAQHMEGTIRQTVEGNPMRTAAVAAE